MDVVFQVACRLSVNCSFQVLTWNEVWTLTQPLQDINIVVFTPFMRNVVFMFEGFVLLGSKPSAGCLGFQKPSSASYPLRMRLPPLLDFGDGVFLLMWVVWLTPKI